MFHRPIRSLIMLIAAFFLLFGLLPVMAQDIEPVPTAEPEAPVVVVPDEQPITVPEGSVILPAWQLFAFIFSGILGGGALGVAGVGVLARNIMNNPATLKNAEAVGNSVPQQTAERLIDLADSAMSVAALAKEMLDRVPAETKATGGYDASTPRTDDTGAVG